MVFSDQTRPLAPAAFMSLEYLNFLTVPAVRPKIPCRLGPMAFLPATSLWHALHLLNTLLPLAASPSAQAGAGTRPAETAYTTAIIAIFRNFIETSIHT